MGDFDKMVAHYTQLLTYINSTVTCNDLERAMVSILDTVSFSKDPHLLQRMYEITLEALDENRNFRLWFKMCNKLGTFYLEIKAFDKLQVLLGTMKKAVETRSGFNNEAEMLEILALEIIMSTSQNNVNKVQELYRQSLQIQSAISSPLTMGTIMECGGKMKLKEGKFDEARSDFFEAFKNFDDAGSSKRMAPLKYFILASMLTESDINPFDCPEIKPYKSTHEVKSSASLIAAYQACEPVRFIKILTEGESTEADDFFFKEYIDILIFNCRAQAVLKYIKPYNRVDIGKLAEELQIPNENTEALLVKMIIDRTIEARIDQVNNSLIIKTDAAVEIDSRYSALNRYISRLDSSSSSIVNRLPTKLFQVHSP